MKLRYQIDDRRFVTLDEAAEHLAGWYQMSNCLPEIIDRCTGQSVPDAAAALGEVLLKQHAEASDHDAIPIPTFTDADGVKHMGIPA